MNALTEALNKTALINDRIPLNNQYTDLDDGLENQVDRITKFEDG